MGERRVVRLSKLPADYRLANEAETEHWANGGDLWDAILIRRPRALADVAVPKSLPVMVLTDA